MPDSYKQPAQGQQHPPLFLLPAPQQQQPPPPPSTALSNIKQEALEHQRQLRQDAEPAMLYEKTRKQADAENAQLRAVLERLQRERASREAREQAREQPPPGPGRRMPGTFDAEEEERSERHRLYSSMPGVHLDEEEPPSRQHGYSSMPHAFPDEEDPAEETLACRGDAAPCDAEPGCRRIEERENPFGLRG